MSNNWLKELKAGDRVFVCNTLGNKSLETVQRVTPTGRVVVNNIQYIAGVHRIDMWRNFRLEEADPSKIWEYKTQRFAMRVFNAMKEKKSITYEQAKEINKILELGVELYEK